MDKKILKNYQIFSVIFTFILGTLLHFLYNLSGENKLVASFSTVNESTWEHLKLFFFPMLMTIIIGYFYIGKNTPNFVCSKTIGIIISLITTVVFFYTYSGILGTNVALIDISSFFIITILGELIAYKLMNFIFFKCNFKKSIIILIILLICFIIFTYFPPHIGLFKDPVTGRYGI